MLFTKHLEHSFARELHFDLFTKHLEHSFASTSPPLPCACVCPRTWLKFNLVLSHISHIGIISHAWRTMAALMAQTEHKRDHASDNNYGVVGSVGVPDRRPDLEPDLLCQPARPANVRSGFAPIIPLRSLRIGCPRCRWLHRMLPASPGCEVDDDDDDTDTHHTLEEFEDPWRSRVLDGLHADVSPIRKLVLETQLLYNGRLVQRPGETCQWIRFPLRCELPRQGLHAGDCHYTVGCKSYSPLVACGPVCHNTTLRSLVQPNPTCEHGRGIFLDGALSWGTSTHHGMSGVYYHAGPDQRGDGGIWTFRPGSYPSPDDAWVALELYVTAAKVLKGGCPLRYCINATADRRALNPLWCPYAVIVAMLVPLPDVPSYVTLR